jgi:hypothetical protein
MIYQISVRIETRSRSMHGPGPLSVRMKPCLWGLDDHQSRMTLVYRLMSTALPPDVAHFKIHISSVIKLPVKSIMQTVVQKSVCAAPQRAAVPQRRLVQAAASNQSTLI